MRRFFAHSISVARSPAGRNLNGAGSVFAIWRSASAFDGRIRPTALGCEVAQLAKRRRVERSGADALHPERGEASAQLAGGLVGEGDRHDPRRRERAGRDLLRDPARDRRRLARARAREDADRAAHRLGRAPLLRVQAVERVHLATVPPPSARVRDERSNSGPDGYRTVCFASWTIGDPRVFGVRPEDAPPLGHGSTGRRSAQTAQDARESTEALRPCARRTACALAGRRRTSSRSPSTSRKRRRRRRARRGCQIAARLPAPRAERRVLREPDSGSRTARSKQDGRLRHLRSRSQKRRSHNAPSRPTPCG